jgi:transposase
MGFQLILVNPFLIKQMPGRKSDVKDAQWIATLLHKGLLRSSLVPSKEIRELRTYSRRYVKLQQRQTSVLTDMERTLEMCSIRITSFVSNISGKSVLKVIEQIVHGETTPDILVELIHGRIVNAHTKQNIKESLTGFITEHHRFMLELSLQEYELLVSQSNKCLMKMGELCNEHYKNEMKLLLTIPGISDISAMIVLAETGADMKAFENSGKFSGWTGLRPRNDESAGKYKSTATTKGNRFLRAMLVQIAWAASRTRGTYFKEKFGRLAMRKSRKKALIAIARKVGVLIWNVLYYRQEYNPEKLIVYEPGKLHAKILYHLKEYDRLQKLIRK